MEKIDGYAISNCENLRTIRFIGENPPTLEPYAISEYGMYGNDYTIYVPETAIDAYMNSDWSDEYKGRIASSLIPDDYIIRYTTSDNTKIKISLYNSADYFGANIIAHNYADGEGTIVFADKPTKISNRPFKDCNNLTSITIPDSVTSIGSSAFEGCSSITSITIPNSVTSIGSSAFLDCSSLTSITIPDSVTSIGSSAFEGCSSITSIIIPNSVTSIGDYAFLICSSLTSITIPDSITAIGSYTFCGCSSLTSITIPDSVTSIGNYAFYECSSLTSIYCKAQTPPSIYHNTFSYWSQCTLYVPTGCKDAYAAADEWQKAKEIIEMEF